MVSVQRDQAVAAAIRALGATRLTMTLPKLMRWPEFEASDCVGHLYFPPDVVWFVALKGDLADFTLGLPHAPRRYHIGYAVIDAATSWPTMPMESPGSAWPAWFDALPNHPAQ